MGTNYYVAQNMCDCCKRYDEKYHIGKSSWGWAFTFQGYDNLKSWQDWKVFLKDKTIMDEYREKVDYNWFVTFVETEKSPGYVREDGHKNLSHNEMGKRDKYPFFRPEYDWDDADGYSFTSTEFS